MPDDPQCLRAIREINPKARAILSTGHGRDGRAQQILDRGRLEFILPHVLREPELAVPPVNISPPTQQELLQKL
jgi:hypothetical protein